MALKVQLKAPGKKNGAPCFGLSSCEKWIKWIVFRWCTFKNTLLLFGLITPNFRMMLHKTCSTLTQTHTRTTFSIWLWVNFYGPQRVFVYLQPFKIISSCVCGGMCCASLVDSRAHYTYSDEAFYAWKRSPCEMNVHRKWMRLFSRLELMRFWLLKFYAAADCGVVIHKFFCALVFFRVPQWYHSKWFIQSLNVQPSTHTVFGKAEASQSYNCAHATNKNAINSQINANYIL